MIFAAMEGNNSSMRGGRANSRKRLYLSTAHVKKRENEAMGYKIGMPGLWHTGQPPTTRGGVSATAIEGTRSAPTHLNAIVTRTVVKANGNRVEMANCGGV